MMRRWLVLLLLAISRVQGQPGVQPNGLDFSAEWLYMQLSASQPAYVINSSAGSATVITGDRIATSQNWHSGYRATGVYSIQDGLGELFVRWTAFPRMGEKNSESGTGLFGVLNHPAGTVNEQSGTATITDKYNLQFIDLLLKQKVIRRPCYSLSLNGGVQYARLDFEENIFYPHTTNSYLIESRSRIKGVGPEIGADYLYGFSNCFTFVSSIYGGGLLSMMNKSFEQVNTAGSIIAQVENDKYWTFVVSMDLRLGLRYSLPINVKQFRWGLDCWNLDVEVGYEILSFFNGMERIYFVSNNSSGSSFNERRTLTMQGPYLHLGASF
ncbi:MAG: hypothetical protein K1000chlam4_00030 [Chlamydiae bacterium]|nr:hypothetical protein [Chlamydiota bacterium]